MYKTERKALHVTLSDTYGDMLTLFLQCIKVYIWRRNATILVKKKQLKYFLIKIFPLQ